jgi:Icc protein
LSDDLRAHADRPCLVALHHHPVPMQSAWLDRLALEQPAALLAIVDACPNVKAVIWGHVHQAFEAARNGVRLLGSPSTCMQFKPHCETFTLDTQPPGYRWLRLADDGSITSGIRRLERAPTLPSSRMNSVPQ